MRLPIHLRCHIKAFLEKVEREEDVPVEVSSLWSKSVDDYQRILNTDFLPITPINELIDLYHKSVKAWKSQLTPNSPSPRPSITVFNALLKPALSLTVLKLWSQPIKIPKKKEYSIPMKIWLSTIGGIIRLFNNNYFPPYVHKRLNENYSGMYLHA